MSVDENGNPIDAGQQPVQALPQPAELGQNEIGVLKYGERINSLENIEIRSQACNKTIIYTGVGFLGTAVFIWLVRLVYGYRTWSTQFVTSRQNPVTPGSKPN
jgi:hypothetical protein